MNNLTPAKNKQILSIIAATAPIAFALIAIFITRSSVQTYFTLILGLFVLELYLLKKLGLDFKNSYPYMLITASGVGIAASSILTIEKIELLKNADFVTSCSISPVVACSPIINSPQASTLVVPNPVVGMLVFGSILAAGMTLLAINNRLKLPKWWWRSLLAGALLGFISVLYLAYVSLYQINALCLYCISAWIVTIPVFTTTLKMTIDNKSVSNTLLIPSRLKQIISKYPLEVTVAAYLILALLILEKFWSYWITLI